MTEIEKAAPPPIRANLLGTVQITVGSRTIRDDDWSLRSARSLFLLLLITPGHALPTERVLDALWPAWSAEQSRNALYKALHALRRVLEPDLERGRQSSYIESHGGMIGLVSTVDVWVDVRAFEEEIRLVLAADPAERRKHLRNALGLYGGELLPTDPYDDWPVARREALHEAREGAVLELALLDLDAGEAHASVAPLESLLADDPSVEAAHRALMRAYAATGQRDRALRQYSRCRLALEEELGTEPDPETEALYSTIHDAQPDIKPDIVSARFNNLPVEPTEIVGRERESEAVQGLLWRQDVHLVTLTGPGGVGKTRLAIDAAAALMDDFADGVAFVVLATVRKPKLVILAIADTLGVNEEPGKTLGASLQKHLGEREMLLVLDNVEHLLDAAGEVRDLLAKCCGLTVLVTSRERLQLRGEHVYEVAPLALPHPDRLAQPDMLSRYGSVALFQQNLRLHRPDFEVTQENSSFVSAICRHLEGLPLAIELLTTKEQILFRRLAAFVGGLTRGAAEAVCDTSQSNASDLRARLHSLAEKHLIQWEETDDEPRFTMLETIREFALEELRKSGEEAEIKHRHAEFYLSLAIEAEPNLTGACQVEWIERLDAEQGNLRSALGWALAQADDTGTLAVNAAAALWRYWWTRGLLSEGVSWLEQSISRPYTEPKSRTSALVAMASLIAMQSDYSRAASIFNEGLSLSRKAGDSISEAHALNGLGEIAEIHGKYDQATSFHEQALDLYRQNGHLRESAGSLNNLATVAYYQGRYEEAVAVWEEALALVRQLGDLRATGLLLGNLGSAAMTRSDFESAVSLHEENLSVARQLHDPGAIGRALSNLAEAVQLQNEQDVEHVDLLEEALALVRQQEDRHCEASVLTFMGNAAFNRTDMSRAAALFAEGLQLSRETGDLTVITHIALLERIAALAIACSCADTGIRLIGVSDALRAELGSPIMPYLRPIRDDSLERAKKSVDEDALASALDEGKQLSQEAMFDEALDLCSVIQRKFKIDRPPQPIVQSTRA